jgi:hypothetical protein
VVSRLGYLDDGRSRTHQGRHVGRRFTGDERTLFTKDERGATTHRLQILAFKHEDKIVGLKVTLWSSLEESVFHVELKGENLSAYVTGGKVELFCLSCARYYQGAAVLDGYFLVKTEFHHGSFDVFLRKLDEAQVLLSNPRKRSVELR